MACDSPWYGEVKGKVDKVPFPCGKCPACKKRRVDSWVFRLMEEDKVSSSAHFVTLTYDNRHVPMSPNGFMTLTRGQEGCFTKYMKRLRKLTSNKLKYYVAGEYGTSRLYGRPHWHAIIFNVPDDGMFFEAWHLEGKPIGNVTVGRVTGDSIAYTMKYIDKMTTRRKHSRDDRVPEFATMSKGLGASYLTPEVKKWHGADYSRLYILKRGGIKIALPRYYRERIYDADDSGAQIAIIDQAMKAQDIKQRLDFARKYSDIPGYTYEQYVESLRYGRYQSFYSRQNRKL